jgi:hypothetical protein
MSPPHHSLTCSGTSLIAPCLLAAAGCSHSSPSYEPTTTGVNGHTVFIIYSTPCPKNASCPVQVVIDKQPYQYPDGAPKAAYRSRALFAVGPDEEAHLIPSLSTTAYRVLALRIGTTWALAYSAGIPNTPAVQRKICNLQEELPRDSYCVTHLGFATTEPFDPSRVPAPSGNGPGPAGTCNGTETAPPCGPGVVPGKYYPYTWAAGCSQRAFFDGRTWQGTLRPTQQQPPIKGWIILTEPNEARWTAPNGTDSLTPVAGPPPTCPEIGA